MTRHGHAQPDPGRPKSATRPPRNQLAPAVADAPEVVLRNNAAAAQAVLGIVRRGAGIELRGRPHRSGRALTIEEAHDELGRERLNRKRALGPGLAEVRQVPPLGNETVEASQVSQDRLHGVMGQVVAREEAPLLPILTLPRDRAVGPPTTQGRGTIGFLLDVNHEVAHGDENEKQAGAGGLEPPTSNLDNASRTAKTPEESRT